MVSISRQVSQVSAPRNSTPSRPSEAFPATLVGSAGSGSGSAAAGESGQTCGGGGGGSARMGGRDSSAGKLDAVVETTCM